MSEINFVLGLNFSVGLFKFSSFSNTFNNYLNNTLHLNLLPSVPGLKVNTLFKFLLLLK